MSTLFKPSSIARRMTLPEYLARPEGSPRCEFENGELVPMTQPSPEHQDVLVELCHTLRAFVRGNKLGKVFAEPDVILPDGRGYIPDIAFVTTANIAIYDPSDKMIHGAPDLVIEIISSRPSRDRIGKFEVYLANGVEWYWLVDPQSFDIEEYRFSNGSYVRAGGVAAGADFVPQLFPGLTINLAELLADPVDHEPSAPVPTETRP